MELEILLVLVFWKCPMPIIEGSMVDHGEEKIRVIWYVYFIKYTRVQGT